MADRVSAVMIGPSGNIFSSGINHTTAYGLKTATTATTTQTSNIANVSLLGGLITATSIRAVANVAVTTSTLTPSSTGSGFTDLVIAGQKIKPTTAANTVIQLANLGTVTVNFVNTGTYGTQAVGIEVETLRITVNNVQ